MTASPETPTEDQPSEIEEAPLEFDDSDEDDFDELVVILEAEPNVQFNLPGRLGALPAVVTLRDAAVRSCERVRSYSKLLNATLLLAELSADIVGVFGGPVVELFSAPLSYVDGLACRGLDKVQAVYPDIVNKQPREIINDALQLGRKKCADAKGFGISKVQTVKAVAAGAVHAAAHPVQTMSTCSHHILEASCKVLEAADAALDRRIAQQDIAAPVGPSAHVAQALAVLKLLDTVARKAQACARVHASAQAAAMSERANTSLARLRYFVTGPLNSPEALTLRQVCQSLDTKIQTFLIDPLLVMGYCVFLYVDTCCSGFLTRLIPALRSREQETAANLDARDVPDNGNM